MPERTTSIPEAKSLVLSKRVRETARMNHESVRSAYKRIDRNIGAIDFSFCTQSARRQGRGFLPHCVIDRGGDRGRLLGPFLSKNIPFTIRLNKRTLIDVDTQEAV